MRVVLSLLKKDYRVFFKDRVSVGLTFLVPMVLITIFGLIFGGSGSSGPSGIRLIVVNESQSDSANELIEKLKEESTFTVYSRIRNSETENGEEYRPMEREDAIRLLKDNAGSYRYALVFPENLIDEGFGLNLGWYYNPQNGIENQMVQGLLQKFFFTEAFPILLKSTENGITEDMRDAFNDDLADAIVENFGADRDEIMKSLDRGFFGSTNSAVANAEGESSEGEAEASSENSFGNGLGDLVKFEKEQIYGKGKNPAAQSVGGWAVMFLLFSLTGAASSLFEERDAGIFQRILAGSARREHILWSKFLFCSSLGLAQMLFLILFGDIVFGIIDSPSQWLPLFVVSLFAAGAATAFGMLLSSISRTIAQANGLGTILILTMSALGGAMFPSFMIPEFIRTYISPLTLVHWAMDGILGVLWRDAGISDILLPLGVLGGITGVVLAVALGFFRRGHLFR